MKGSSLGGNLFEQKPSTDQPSKGFHSIGTWCLERKEKCLPIKTCLVCGTAPLCEASEMDTKLVKAAKDKQKGPGKPKLLPNPQENDSFSATALSTFKASKRRRVALSARSGFKKNRPNNPDTNIWENLIASRRGYSYSAKVLTKVLMMFRAAGSQSISGPEPVYQKAVWLLFSAERENSCLTVTSRKGTPAFPLVEVKNILFLSGRKLASGPPYDRPSVHQQDNHWILKDSQESQFMVPVLNPSTALGVAVAQQVHDEFCGASPATSLARTSRYLYFTPSA